MMRKTAAVLVCGLFLALIAQGQPSTTAESNAGDRLDVAVTVYNNDRALVRERREFSLPEGEVALKFMDVAEQIIPETVSLESVNAPGKLHILEQNYEYDLMSPQKLMEKYVGRDVRLISRDENLGSFQYDAKLLSLNEGPVYEIDGEIYLGHPGNVVLPEIPEELIAKPTLIWLLSNQEPKHETEVTYLTRGMSWRADYVVTLARTDDQLGLTGWVTLDNGSGATYENARLKLVAGDVNIVQETRAKDFGARGGAMMYAQAAMPEPMREEAFAEYHLYTLPRRTTIKQNQTKQVLLLTGDQVPARKIYQYRGNVQLGVSGFNPDQPPEHAGVYLRFDNKEENNLGMPLPAGTMRVYQADSEGMLQLAGEDRIRHTPKDEEVELRLGEAFDVIVERKQTDYNRISDKVHEVAVDVVLRNHKEQDILVEIVESMPGDWEILSASVPHEKDDAHTAVFEAPVPADGKTQVTYRVRMRL